MGSILSLIFLTLLVSVPMLLAGRELLEVFFVGGIDPLFGKAGNSEAARMNKLESDENKVPVYDGMITVEIPVSEPQVVAYESPPHFDTEIEIIGHSSQA